MELFNEDRIAHPWNPNVFVVPRLMKHLSQKSLSKDADLLLEAQVGDHFWSKDQYKLLIITIVLPVTHVSQHRGPWVARGSDKSVKTYLDLTRGFKLGTKHDPGGLHVMDGVLCQV